MFWYFLVFVVELRAALGWNNANHGPETDNTHIFMFVITMDVMPAKPGGFDATASMLQVRAAATVAVCNYLVCGNDCFNSYAISIGWFVFIDQNSLICV